MIFIRTNAFEAIRKIRLASIRIARDFAQGLFTIKCFGELSASFLIWASKKTARLT
jgi:hypothetical protein